MKNIGGQAVIEGVMMKGRKGWTVAVRGPKGDIHVKREGLSELPKVLRLPVVRGVIALYYALSIGVRAIEFSASNAYAEEDGVKLNPISIGFTIGLSVILGIALFILLPLYATRLLGIVFVSVSKSSFVFNLVDGIIRIFFFLTYIVSIGMWKEIRRIFEYHGAEHKVIHAYENGKELTVKNIKGYSPLHPRCGTSFLLIVMVISILTFSSIPQEWSFFYKFLSRLILIPVIAGLSFEFLKLFAKNKDNPIINLFIQPGLLLQKLTTREPDDAQIEVAIRALEEVLKIEESNV
ncbi:MAG: hypothetical protein A2Z47_04065 [Thermodesulfovibrio sp. RBG_19FT_COMBO_42_12]|nr:MAG: hypothetical protein A2Z47_04065 [Thermodesulfovibrio sp. RBG_19FT_COMBO_42_12]